MFPTKSNMQPRFNIAATRDVDFVHHDKAWSMELNLGRWWLVPFFAKEISKHSMFNARIESVDTSGAFREGLKSRRGLIPADGYFEWTKGEDGGKDPWLLQMPGREPFSFAGICAHSDNLGVTSCTIITAPAVPEIEHIHTRMIGVCDVFDIADGEGEIGYWIEQEVWGRGFGLEAAERLVRFALEDVALNTIEAGCADDNVASSAILPRLGFDRVADVRVFSQSRETEITQRRFLLGLNTRREGATACFWVWKSLIMATAMRLLNALPIYSGKRPFPPFRLPFRFP